MNESSMGEFASSATRGDAPVALDRELSRALEIYLEGLEAGRAPDVDSFVADYPRVAERLRVCIDSLQTIENAVVPLSSAGMDVGLGDSDDHHGENSAGTRAGLVVGDFRVLREVGRGGMGVVYEAEQVSLSRRVALKVLPFASMLDARQLERFRIEAQAAARLHHSNIVPVYAVGSDRGLHYYAMQFIQGRTLAEIISDLRDLETGNLPNSQTAGSQSASAQSTSVPAFGEVTPGTTTRSRRYFESLARLGVQAARGLAYAHAAGVVHRDVKPSNLLVDDAGTLWITDFGLAKISGDASITLSGDVIGTLRYMSPEQARAIQLPVDHRSDIYSLGATLYELATFAPVVRGKGREEILREIALDAPRAPRRLNTAIPAELETIILKTLEKDPHDRYATCAELADDLDRFLDHRPIQAKPPGPLQRLVKWTRRHRAAALAAITMLFSAVIVLSVILVVTLRSERRVRDALGAVTAEKLATAAEADRARGNYRLASEAVELFVTRVADEKLENTPGMSRLRAELLEEARDFHGRMLAANPDDMEARHALAMAWLNLAPARVRIGQDADGEAAYREAIRRLSELQIACSDSCTKLGVELATARGYLSEFLVKRGRGNEAIEEAETALASIDALVEGTGEVSRGLRLLRVRCLGVVGQSRLRHVGSDRGGPEALREALSYLERANVELRALVKSDPDDDSSGGTLAGGLENVGMLLTRLRDAPGALTRYDEARSIREKLLEKTPNDAKLRASLAKGWHVRGYLLYFEINDSAKAADAYRQAIKLREPLAKEYPENVEYLSNLAASRNELAMMVEEDGELAEARELLESAVVSQREAIKRSGGRPIFRNYLENHLSLLGRVREKQGDMAGAIEAARESVSVVEGLVRDMPGNPSIAGDLAAELAVLVRRLESQKRFADSEPFHRRLVELATRRVQAKPNASKLIEAQAVAHGQLAFSLRQQDKTAEAESSYREGLKIYEDLARKNLTNPSIQNHRGDMTMDFASLLDTPERLEEAEALALRALEAYELGVEHRPGYTRYEDDLRAALGYVSGILQRRGKIEEAVALARKIPEVPNSTADAWVEAAKEIASCAKALDGDDEGLTRRREMLESEAIEMLREAKRRGFADWSEALADEAFVNLRARAELKEALDDH